MSMPRYLTAQKTSLLVLVKLYCQSILPSSATIPILSFILSHAIPHAPSHARPRRSQEPHHVSTSIQAFEQVLHEHASSMPGRTLLDVFLKQMWEINSFDALHNLFASLEVLFAKERDENEPDGSTDRICLSKTSPIGAFVRRARLEFTRLQFDDGLKLWSAFITYRAPTAQWSKRIAGLASSGVDVIASNMGLQAGDEIFEIAYGHLADEEERGHVVSQDDCERLLEYQLDQMQRVGNRVPDDMRTQLRIMFSSSGVVLRQSHLVKFFDAWRAGDYTSAFDNIHRYYDYAMHAREKIHYQYALLHMAILQADFGCFSEAIAAINETIATARENQDMTCLNFSLSWLNHMSKAYPKQMKSGGYMGMLGSERDGLTFLKAKSKETKMYPLLSATLLNESRLCMATGESISRAYEYMFQASHLNIKENINNHGGQMILHSTLCTRLGISHLTGVYCDLLLHCYQDSCPIDERIRAACRSAFSVMQTGRYDVALRKLEEMDPSTNRTLKFHQYIFFCTGLIKLKRAIRHTDWHACDTLLASLGPDSSTDPEISFLLSEARTDYLISRGLFSEAFTAIEDNASALRDQGADILQRISMLTTKAALFAKIGKPERGFSIGLRAASVAYKARLMPSLWCAVGLLCNILNSLGEYGAASRLLRAIIPQTLESTDVALTGGLYSHMADSYVGMAGRGDAATPTGARARATNMSRAELYIDRARECYKRVEDIDGECEQLMKTAIIAKLRGDEKLAEEWAQNHNRVWEEAKQRLVEGDRK